MNNIISNMKILSYPKDPNPYQELLYFQMRNKIEVKYLENPTGSQTIGLLLLPYQVIYYRIKGFNIFHLHFYYLFSSPVKHWLFNNIFTKIIYSLYYIIFLLLIKSLQYKLVWTVHNLLWEESQFINDLWVIRIMSKLSDLKFVHSQSSLEIMEKLNINTRHTKIISIGNYSTLYPNTLNKQISRKILGISNNSFVFGYLGIIDTYKGLPVLLQEFQQLKVNNSVLVITGKCTNPKLKQKILEYNNYNNIRLYLEYIPNDKVQLYLNSADVMVYPFTAITTSSSIILGLSFGKPVIYPRLGNLKDLPDDIGFSYNPIEKHGLIKSMKKAVTNKNKLKELGDNAKNYTDSLSWDKIADITYNSCKDLIESSK